MVPRSNHRRLIVEGYDDLQSIAALMGSYIPWPQEKRAAPVWIEISNGAEEILREGFLSAYIKSPEVQTLGVVLDADINPSGRYVRICSLCKGFFELPETLPGDGIVVEKQHGILVAHAMRHISQKQICTRGWHDRILQVSLRVGL